MARTRQDGKIWALGGIEAVMSAARAGTMLPSIGRAGDWWAGQILAERDEGGRRELLWACRHPEHNRRNARACAEAKIQEFVSQA